GGDLGPEVDRVRIQRSARHVRKAPRRTGAAGPRRGDGRHGESRNLRGSGGARTRAYAPSAARCLATDPARGNAGIALTVQGAFTSQPALGPSGPRGGESANW